MLRRISELAARLAWANCFTIVAVLFIVSVFSCEQGRQLLHLANESEIRLGRILALWMPLFTCSALLQAAYFVASRAYLLTASVPIYKTISVRRWASVLTWVVLPCLISAIPGMTVSFQLKSWSTMVVAAAMSVIIALILEKASRKTIRVNGRITKINKSIYWFTCPPALIVILIYFFCVGSDSIEIGLRPGGVYPKFNAVIGDPSR
jgi:hypothetical protein